MVSRYRLDAYATLIRSRLRRLGPQPFKLVSAYGGLKGRCWQRPGAGKRLPCREIEFEDDYDYR